MTAELLASVAGIILSLGFSYIPGLNVKYAGWGGDGKDSVGMRFEVAE